MNEDHRGKRTEVVEHPRGEGRLEVVFGLHGG